MVMESTPLPIALNIPPLIYGTADRGSGKPSRIHAALSMGHRAFDTASNPLYDERSLGVDLASVFSRGPLAANLAESVSRREQVIIQAKYSSTGFFRDQNPPYALDDTIPLQVLKSIQQTITRLQIDHVDVYFLHRPFSLLGRTFAAWEVMEEIVRQGGAKCLGISQVDLKTLQTLFEKADIKPAVVQNHFSNRNNYDSDLRRYCKEKGIVYQAFGVLDRENRRLLSCPAVTSFSASQRVGREAALFAVLLAAAIHDGETFCLLDGSRNEEHMAENWKAVNIVRSMTAAQIERIAWTWEDGLKP